MNFLTDFLWTSEFWLMVGIGLLILEVMTISFYALFLGIGALVTSLAVKMGWANALWVQFTLFSVVSVVSTLLFRDLAKRYFFNSKSEYRGDFVGERATVTKSITPGSPGKVSYRGTEWTAETSHRDTVLEPGTSVLIKEQNGMTLWVE